jgi:predicted XRE-type DNA-binding protein
MILERNLSAERYVDVIHIQQDHVHTLVPKQEQVAKSLKLKRGFMGMVVSW